jgi:hypothetical protein
MSMHAMRRLLPAVATAVSMGALLVACGGSGTGLISTADAGPLVHDFEEVARQAHAGNGSCTATKEALESTEADFAKIAASIDRALRSKLQQGINHLRTQALEECARTTTSSTTVTTRTRTTETLAPVTTTTSSETTAAPPTSSSSNGGEEGTGGGGTQAPGGGENLNPGGAEAQGGPPNENGGGGVGNGEGR